MRRSKVQSDLSSPSHRTPAVILCKCFVRGEIERQEFLQWLEDLDGR